MNNWPSFCRNKIVDPSQIGTVVSFLKAKDLTIATLNGSFDLLHAGHLHMIHEAKKQADILFMALNSDSSIKAYKSPKRPIVPLEYRLQMISGLEDVDYVTWFEEINPLQVLSRIKPHVHVNGSEYGENCIEADVVKEGGGKIHIVNLVEGLSTTNIVNKIKSVCD